MTDPIPLRSPEGSTFAFACGSCRKLKSPACLLVEGVLTDVDVAEGAEDSRERAEKCCTCATCGARKDPNARSEYCIACKQANEEARKAYEARIEEHRKHVAERRQRSLLFARDQAAAASLELLMISLSEQFFSARWLEGWEVRLWKGVLKRELDFIEDPLLAQGQAQLLRRLSETSGGWWRYGEFVPLREWLSWCREHDREKK